MAVRSWVLTSVHKDPERCSTGVKKVTVCLFLFRRAEVEGGRAVWRSWQCRTVGIQSGTFLTEQRSYGPGALGPHQRTGGIGVGMAWHGMVDVCDGCLAAEASGSSFGWGQCH